MAGAERRAAGAREKKTPGQAGGFMRSVFVDTQPVTRLPPRRRGVCGLQKNLSTLSVDTLAVSYESEDESISFS